MIRAIPACLAVVLLQAVPPAVAQEELEDEFALLEEELADDEVKSASKRRQSIYLSPSAVTVFTREDIQASGAENLWDLLRRVPNMDVYEMKPSFAIVGARALTDASSNLILLLVDGREAMEELSGLPFWTAQTVNLDEIERVEVIRGPGSTLYGANAFAAVVNVTTLQERTVETTRAHLSAGEEGLRRVFGSVRRTWTPGGGVLDLAAGLGCDGRRSPSDPANDIREVRIRSHATIRYRHAQWLDLSLHAGVLDGSGVIFIQMGDALAELLSHNTMARLSAQIDEGVTLHAQAYHNRHVAGFHYTTNLQAYGTWVADIPDLHFDSNTVDTKVQLDWAIRPELVAMGGGNFRFTSMEANRTLPRELTELRGAGFVHVQWSPAEELQLTGGFRLDLNSETEPALSPRAVAVWRPRADQSLRAGYALAFRKPSFGEGQLHIEVDNYNRAFPEVPDKIAEQFGNEDLANEKVHSFDAGWRGGFLDGSLTLSVDLFANLYRDTIFFHIEAPLRLGLPDIARSTMQYENQPDTILAVGGEAEIRWQPRRDWHLWANLGLRRVTELESGEALESEPALRFNTGGRITFDDGILLDLALHYVSEYEFAILDPRSQFDAPNPLPLGDAWLLIGRLGYRLANKGPGLEAGFAVRAPLGAPFREMVGFSIPTSRQTVSHSDFGGERIVRLVSFYLRGWF